MYEVTSGVRSTSNEDGGAVLDVNQGKVFHLNGIGAQIFERLVKREDTLQITAEISRICGISSEVVEADVLEFLDLLEEYGLVRKPEEVAASCTT